MTDKELLELAAKAAGIDKSQIEIDGRIDGYDVNGEPIILKGWNPLTDDGDALRLAVKLRLAVDVLPWGTEARLWKTPNDNSLAEPKGGDPYAATRRAVVRAAAEIGKTL